MGRRSSGSSTQPQTADTNWIANRNPALPTGPAPTMAQPYNIGTMPSQNIFTQAQQGITGAGLSTAAGMDFGPGTLATTNLAPYFNPYTQEVIDVTMGDLERQRQMQQNMLGAQATAARAFGGSRQGVEAALTNEGFARQMAQTSAGLRQAGFQQSQVAAQQDIQNRLQSEMQLANISNLGFGMGQSVQQQMAQQGLQQQMLQQALMDAAKGQYAGYTGAPAQSLGYMAQALGATPVPQTQTTTRQPGLFDYLTMGAGILAAPVSGGGSVAGSLFGSDIRLKTNIKRIGTLPNGLPMYQWAWNEIAKKLGLDDNPTTGVMAHEAREVMPEAVIEGEDGYLRVNYGMILGV